MRCGRLAKLLAVSPLLAAVTDALRTTYLVGIDNCPATTTGLPTGTATSTTAATGTGAATEYFFELVAPAVPRRRQIYTAPYIGPDGEVVSNCTNALKFTFSNGELISGGQHVAASGSDNSITLAPTGLLGPNISTTFSIDRTNLLSWYYPTFYNNGYATYCITGYAFVNAVLHVGPPSGCVPVNIGVHPASSCPGYVPPSNSASSPTTGPTSSTGGNGNPTTGASVTPTPTGGPVTPTPTGGPSPTGSASSPTGTTATSTITSPIAQPTVTGSGAMFRNTGCYNDPPVGNPLDGPSFTSSGLTAEGCADFCAPYNYFALENGDVCFCGNNVNQYAYPIFTQPACNVVCTGNRYELCGASEQFILYSIIARSATIVPTTTITGTPTAFTISSTSTSVVGPASSPSTSGPTQSTTGSSTSTPGGPTSNPTSTPTGRPTSTTATNGPGVTTTSTTLTNGPGVTTTSTTSTNAPGATTTSSTTTSTTTEAHFSPSGLPVCPVGQDTYFTTTNGRTYFTECGTDFPGGDLPAVTVLTLEACIYACDAFVPGAYGPCIGVSLTHVVTVNNCYLKFAIGTPDTDAPVIDSARLVSGPGAPSVTASTTLSISIANGGGQQTTTSMTSTVNGGGQSTTSSSTSTANGGGQSTTASTTLSTTSTTTFTHITATGTSTDFPCPDFNQQVFTSDAQNQYHILCQTDLSGPDITAAPANDLEDCLGICDQYNNVNGVGACKGVVFATNNVGGNNCYLKQSADGAPSSPIYQLDSALLICNSCPSISASTSTATSTTSTITTATTVTTPTSIASVSTTSTAATATTPTTSTMTATALPPPSLCPDSNGGTYVTPENYVYDIVCGTDFNFGDIENSARFAASLQDCALACDIYNDGNPTVRCVGGTWQEPIPSTVTNCFLKYTLNETPTTGLPQTDSIVLASAYYQNPCPLQNGGQYVTLENHGYEILCGQDLQYNDIQNAAVLANSFQACAQACDAYNDANGGDCVAASWQEYNPAQTTNCYLKALLPLSPTSANAIDSMILTNNPNRVVLSHPTPLMVNTPGGAYSATGSQSTTLPFPLRLYDLQDTLIWVSTTGLLSITEDLTFTNINGPLPTFAIPASCAVPYWGNSYAVEGTQQGVYYQIDGYTVSFEYILTAALDNTQAFHFIVFYDSQRPGIITYYYFQASDAGQFETVGAQGYHNGLPTSNQYSIDVADLTQGLVYQVNTIARTSATGTFDVSTFPAGTWPNGV